MNTETLVLLARYLLGILLIIFGANGIFHFIPTTPHPPKAEHFRQTLVQTGYLLPLWKGAELISALLLLFNVAIPFALILLAPVLVNILLFHLFLSRKGLKLALILTFLELFLVIAYRHAFRTLF